jgi:hypothetical protein
MRLLTFRSIIYSLSRYKNISGTFLTLYPLINSDYISLIQVKLFDMTRFWIPTLLLIIFIIKSFVDEFERINIYMISTIVYVHFRVRCNATSTTKILDTY